MLVYDAEGYFMGASLAELLAVEGYCVDIVTPFGNIAPWCDLTFEGGGIRERLHQLGVGMHREIVITGLEDGRAIGEGGFGSACEFEFDAVVLVTQRFSDDTLYRELAGDPTALAEAEITALYRIGDCVSPRMLSDVVFDGHRLAREIDLENPARPMAHKRERALPPPVPSGRGE